jgi:hypothetical protein
MTRIGANGASKRGSMAAVTTGSNASGDCVTANGASRGQGRGRGNWNWTYPSKEAQQLPGEKALALEALQQQRWPSRVTTAAATAAAVAAAAEGPGAQRLESSRPSKKGIAGVAAWPESGDAEGTSSVTSGGAGA